MSTDSSDNTDRRNFHRNQKQLTIEYRTAHEFLVAYSANISASGVFIESDIPLEPGTGLDIQVSFPGLTEPIAIRGIVRWSRSTAEGDQPAGMGIEFFS